MPTPANKKLYEEVKAEIFAKYSKAKRLPLGIVQFRNTKGEEELMKEKEQKRRIKPLVS
jgi:hypothetical protein